MDVKSIDHKTQRYELNRAVLARRLLHPEQVVDARTGAITTGQPGDFLCTYDPPLFLGTKLISWIETADEFAGVYVPFEHADPEPANVTTSKAADEASGFSIRYLSSMSKKELRGICDDLSIDHEGLMKSELVELILNTNNP